MAYVQVDDGSGNSYKDGTSGSTGTYISISTTLTYDDNPQGGGGNDKTFSYSGPNSGYYSPTGSGHDWSNATSHVFFEYLGVIDGKKTWRWTEYARNSPNDNWPTQPTATGRIEQTS